MRCFVLAELPLIFSWSDTLWKIIEHGLDLMRTAYAFGCFGRIGVLAESRALYTIGSCFPETARSAG